MRHNYLMIGNEGREALAAEFATAWAGNAAAIRLVRQELVGGAQIFLCFLRLSRTVTRRYFGRCVKMQAAGLELGLQTAVIAYETRNREKEEAKCGQYNRSLLQPMTSGIT